MRLAVATIFTDPTLASGVTQIKAAHITELRAAINAVRQAAGLSAASWTDASLSGAVIRAVHVEELRARLTEALTTIGMSAPAYTDATLANVWVKRAHIEELRQAINASGAGVGGGSSPVIARDGFASLSYQETTNRITSPNFAYDAAGNQTITPAPNDSGQQRMEYDAAGRLVRVRDGYGTQLAAYTYGATNQRLIAEEGSQRTYYAATVGSVLAEYTEAINSSAPAWRQSYVYLGGRLLATVENNSGAERTQYHHPDRLGTRLTTNQHDQTTSEQATLPFGNVLSTETSSAPSTSRRFTSYDRSQVTRLDYAVNRHYDPLQGRFTTVDPIGMGAANPINPQSLNLYAYCQNDPVNFTDPTGLFCVQYYRFVHRTIERDNETIVVTEIHHWVECYFTGGGGGGSPFDGGGGGGDRDHPSLSFEDNYDLIASGLRRNQQSRCDRLRRTIEGNAREIERTFNNYDPISDAVPHPHRWGGSTQPGGHYANFNRFQNTLREQIAEYKRDCQDRDGSGYDPSPHERWFSVELRPPSSAWQRFTHNLRRIWDSIPSLEEQQRIRRRYPQYFPPLVPPLPGRVPR